MNGLFEGAIEDLGRALDLRSRRHEMIASNLSNMDIPGYKPFDLIIEEEMARPGGSELSPVEGHPAHLPVVPAVWEPGSPVPATNAPFAADHSARSLDREQTMAALAQNSLIYNATAQIIALKFSGLKNVIQGGRV